MFKKFIAKISPAQKVIAFIVFLFIVGASYLFTIDSRYNDPKYNQDWFALSFSDPQSASFDFTIENFSAQSDFQWEIFVEEEKVSSSLATMAPREKKEIRIKADPQATGRITIRVSSPTETREIYKNIN